MKSQLVLERFQGLKIAKQGFVRQSLGKDSHRLTLEARRGVASRPVLNRLSSSQRHPRIGAGKIDGSLFQQLTGIWAVHNYASQTQISLRYGHRGS
jgi:hypothetical protein